MERTFFKSVLEAQKEKKKQVRARRRLNKLRIVTKLGIHVDAVETKDSSDADEGDESDYDDEAMDRPPARQRRASQMLLEARLERDIDDEDEINFTAEEYQGDGDSGLAALVNNQREKYNARHGEHRHFAKARQKMSLISSTRKSFPGQKSSFHVSDIHAEEHRSDGRGRLGGTMNAGDADGMHSQTSDILLFLDQYLLMEDDSMQRYKEAFTQCNIAYKEQKILILPEVVGALKVVHNNMISDKECQFCLMALDMIKQTGNGEKELVYNFHTFSVIASLSERLHRVGDLLEQHIQRLNFNDFETLQHKILRARAIFYLDDIAQETGSMPFESLRNTCIAGQIDQGIPRVIIASLEAEDKQHMDFLDFLAYLPMFMGAHKTMTSRILDQPERLKSQANWTHIDKRLSVVSKVKRELHSMK